MVKASLKSRPGMTVILAVVIIGAASLIIAKSLAGIGLANLDTVNDSVGGQKTLALADSCLEESLRRLQLNNDFTAVDFFSSFEDGACAVNIASDGMSRMIMITANIGDYYKRIRVETEIDKDGIIMNKWEEMN